jgi:hypothetical protein
MRGHYLTSALLALVGTATASPAAIAAADRTPSSSINVNVTNTPLPVQGTVNIGNFPAASTVNGSVSITGTPNVNVVNTPTVRNADRPSAQPVYVACSQVAPANLCVFDYTVPPGKTLIVTYVSYEIQYPLNDSRLTLVELCTNPCARESFLPVAPTQNNVRNQVSTNGSTVSFGTATQLFFLAGEGIEAFYLQTDQDPAFSILQKFNISGHLEDAP